MKQSHRKTARAEGMDFDEEYVLMGRVAAGDRDAFARLVREHKTGVFRFAYSMAGNMATAEDITQESCLRLWRSADKWKPTGRVRSWLLRIAHNIYMDEMRGSRPGVQIEDFAQSLASPEPDARAAVQGREVSQIVKQALQKLPERQRAALMLVHYSECSNIEAAHIMGVSVDAVESLLARGKRELRALLSPLKEFLIEE